MEGTEVIPDKIVQAVGGGGRHQLFRPTVVVVDDDAQVRRLASIILNRKGYQVLEAGGADEAIVLLDQLSASGATTPGCCVVLLDIMMPGTDGITLCRRIKSEFDVAVIMFTGRAAYTDVQTAIRSGADDYLVKPFTVETLAEKVARHIRVGS